MPAPLDLDGDGTLEFTVYGGGPWHFYNDDGSYIRGVWAGGLQGDLPISRRQLLGSTLVLLSQSYNSDAVGQIAPGWTLYTGQPYVSNLQSVSAPNSFRFDGIQGLGTFVQRSVGGTAHQALEAWVRSERSDSSNVVVSFAKNSCGDRWRVSASGREGRFTPPLRKGTPTGILWARATPQEHGVKSGSR